MADTPPNRIKQRSTSASRTAPTTSSRFSTTGSIGNTSVNIATAFKLSGVSKTPSDSEHLFQNQHNSNVITPSSRRAHSVTTPEEELDSKGVNDAFDNSHSSEVRRLSSTSYISQSPQWVRTTTSQYLNSLEKESESDLDQEDSYLTKRLQVNKPSHNKTENVAPSTVNLDAGRYYLRPRPSTPARFVSHVPAQVHDYSATSSDDDEWTPRTSLATRSSKRKPVEQLLENFRTSSDDEYSVLDTDSDEDLLDRMNTPIWHLVQALVTSCFVGVGQGIKRALSVTELIIFALVWMSQEIMGSLYSYAKTLVTLIFVTPLFASGHILEYVKTGIRHLRPFPRPFTKNLGLVLIISTVSGILWANLSGPKREDTYDRLGENLKHIKYLEKLTQFDDIELRLPRITSLRNYISSMKFDFSSWSLSSKTKATSKASHEGAILSPLDLPSSSKEGHRLSTEPSSQRSNVKSEPFDRLKSRLESLEAALSLITNNFMDRNTGLSVAYSSEATHKTEGQNEIEFLKKRFYEVVQSSKDQQQTIGSIQRAVTKHGNTLEVFTSHVKSLRNQVFHVEKKMDSLDKSLKGVFIDLEQVKERVIEISQYGFYSHQILDSVEQALPKYLIARKNRRTGGIDIAPEFYDYLSTLFITPNQLQAVIQESAAKYHQPHTQFWIEFFETNQKELYSLIQSTISVTIDSMRNSGAVLSKQDFLLELQSKLDELKKQVIAKVQEEINASIRKVTMNELTESVDVVSLANHIIEDALIRHSADILGVPDYALYSGGGRVIRSLTSTTYHVPSKSTLARVVGKYLGLSALGLGNPPTTALNPDTHLGQCWPFPGDHGNLTVSLSREIIPTNFTIEHVPRSIAIDVRSAPRKVAVYALYEIEGDVRDESSHELLHYKDKLYQQQYLSTYEYDVANPQNIQTFPVQVSERISRPTRIIQLRVLSNHGQETYTCLYRFRVHGQIAE